MVFKAVVDNVVAFYKKFGATFDAIDDYFQLINDNGGDDRATAKKIVEKLLFFHRACYSSITLLIENHTENLSDHFFSIMMQVFRQCDGSRLPPDIIDSLKRYGCDLEEAKSEDQYEHQFFKSTLNYIKSNGIDYIVISKCVQELQMFLQNVLVYDAEWAGQKECYELITLLLEHIQDQQDLKLSDKELNAFYATIRILRELVADCSIAICGLGPLAEWNYGTIEYAHLTAEEQLSVLLNQAILTDRMYFCLHSLEDTLTHLNKVIDQFEMLNWSVYYVAGFLNFKVHRYDNARMMFERAHMDPELRTSMNEADKEKYFRSLLFIAYSYEYHGDFACAINVIAGSSEQIEMLLFKYKDRPSSSFSKQLIDELINEARKCHNGNLLELYFIDGIDDFIKKATIRSKYFELQLNIQFEILHALAHCLNEYAIKCITKKSENASYGTIIRVARFIMRFIAEIRSEYWTCYATIHSEYDDIYEAIHELNVAESKNQDNTSKETLMAEISFFRYYFSLLNESRSEKDHSTEEDKKKFEIYYQKYNDGDAKCHLMIFEFRNELRKYFSLLFTEANERDEFTEENLPKVSDNLDKMYQELCNLTPTLYMNINVRAELRLMQRAYDCITLLRLYLLSPTFYNSLRLRNSCKRFLKVYDEFSLNTMHQSEKPYEDVISSETLIEKIASGFFGQQKDRPSIYHSLFNTDSIFILAPISGNIVYRYQTGSIEALFTEQSILPVGNLSNSEVSAMYDLRKTLVNQYFKLFRLETRKSMYINWASLKPFDVDEIFYWSSEVPTQLIAAEYDHPSFVRMITDVDTFSAKIHEFCSNPSYKENCTHNDEYDNHCTLFEVEFKWLEYIHESDDRKKYYIIKSERYKDSYFILPVPRLKTSVHQMHNAVRRITIGKSHLEHGKHDPLLDVPLVRDTEKLSSEQAGKIRALKIRIEKEIFSISKKLEDYKTKGDAWKSTPDAAPAKKINTLFDNAATDLVTVRNLDQELGSISTQRDFPRFYEIELAFNKLTDRTDS